MTTRLKDGVSLEQASSELNGIQQRDHQEFPGELMGKGAHAELLSENLVRDVKEPLYVLLGAVGCVLLIACLNVANLFMARVTARRKEIAVRAALGGSRWRIVQERVTESLLLTLAGGGWDVAGMGDAALAGGAAGGFCRMPTAFTWTVLRWRSRLRLRFFAAWWPGCCRRWR